MTEADAVRGHAAAGAPVATELDGRDHHGPAHPVTLVQFPPVWGRNVSPFGLKLEAWLKLADVPFEIRHSTNTARAPKGKLPYVVDGGRPIGDSTLIIEHLKSTRGIDPDAGLSPRERAEALALQRLFEDHLYFAVLYSRWIDEEGWHPTAEAFFAAVPGPMRGLARNIVRTRIRRVLHHQGMGRHGRDEIHALARADLAAVAEHLGERPFFAGEGGPTTIDAVAYGFLANILLVPLETELKRIALDHPNLLAWCEAMEQGLDGV